jgi:hypothetical protein
MCPSEFTGHNARNFHSMSSSEKLLIDFISLSSFSFILSIIPLNLIINRSCPKFLTNANGLSIPICTQTDRQGIFN